VELLLLLIVIGIFFTIKHIRNKKTEEHENQEKQDRAASKAWYREQIKLRKKKIDPNV
jgi:putative Mn2+ efflux pump MntP